MALKSKLIYANNSLQCVLQRVTFEKKYNERSMENLKPQAIKAKTTDISPAAAKKIQRISKCYLDAIFASRQFSTQGRKQIEASAVFITLTYPSVQKQSDDECKRRHLGEFLKWLKRGALVRAYLWRAETHKNNNIHFHVLTDRYIHHKKLRDVWNAIVAKDGYIEAFYAAHGHRDPNSTDIESISDRDRAAAYISKYVSKGDPSKRLIVGRVWGCSDNIRDLRYYEEEGADMADTIRTLNKDPRTYRKEISEYLTIYKNQKANNYVCLLDSPAASRLEWHNMQQAFNLNLITN